METVVSASISLVVTITTAVQNVTALRQRCHALAAQVQTLQPFLIEVLEQARSKNRGEKVFSANDENQFRALYVALEKASRLVLDLKKTNRVKMALMSTALTTDLSDVSNEIHACLGAMPLLGLQIAADMKANLEKAKDSLARLRDDLKAESIKNAEQLKELEKKMLDAIQGQGSLLTLLHNKEESLQILADHCQTDVEIIKADLEGLSGFADWRMSSKKKAAMEDEYFEQILLALGELDRQGQSEGCDTCHRAVGSIQDLECPICHQQFRDPVVISSGFTYCRECIKRVLSTDTKCPMSREVVSGVMFNNIVVANILRMPETGLHGQKYEERRTSLPIVISTRLDLQTAANEFRSSKPGSRMVGLLSLQAHCESLEGKKEILSEENLVRDILEYLLSPEVGRVPGPFETERTLLILDALTSPPKPYVASSSSAPPIALSRAERDKVFACFFDIDKGLENLVRLMNGTPMANCRVLAAKVMTNVIEGSVPCFSIAREMTGLVTVFSDLAIRGGESSDVGVKGLILLACGHRYDRYDTGDVRQRAEVLIRALMDLTRYGIALEESLVALGAVVGSFDGHVSGFLGDVSQLVSSVSGLPLGDGTYSVMKILLRMAKESTNEGQQDKSRSQGGVPLREVVASFVPKLLEMAKRQAIENGFADQEECIMLLGFLRKSGGWRLEPEQVPCLFDILSQDTASNDARIEILDILAANTDNKRLWRSDAFDAGWVVKLLELIKPQPADSALRRGVTNKLCALLTVPVWLDEIRRAGGVEALCSVVASDDDKLCRSYTIIALERLPRIDAMVEVLRQNVSLKQLVQVFQIQGVDKKTADEARGAAAALMCTLIQDTESEASMIEAMQCLVTFLGGDSHVCHKVKAAEALAELISKAGEIARDWVVASESNVLAVLVEFAGSSVDLGWRGKLYECLETLSHHDDCQMAVINAEGQKLLLEALQAGSQSAAAALVALLVRAAGMDGLDKVVNKVVIAMKLRLQRKVVDPATVKVFAELCSAIHTGISVARNGGIEVLLDLIRRSENCRPEAILALCKLASLKVEDGDEELSSTAAQLKRCRAQIVDLGGFDILFGIAGSQCTEAVEVLAALKEESSAKTRLVERVVELRAMCMKGGRVQELVLDILVYLSRGDGDLSHKSVSKLLTDGFPELLLELLKEASSPTATTAVKMVRNLSVESPEFRKTMLNSGDGAVRALLEALKQPEGLEIRTFAVIALEMFMKDEKGRQHLIDADGVRLVLSVLQQRQLDAQPRLYALKVLLLLSDPPLTPKSVRKQVWSQICSAPILGVLAQAMDIKCQSETILVAAQLLKACVQETSDLSAMCKRLRDAGVFRSLAKLRMQCTESQVWNEADDLVTLLHRKSGTARKALKEEIERQDLFEPVAEEDPVAGNDERPAIPSVPTLPGIK